MSISPVSVTAPTEVGPAAVRKRCFDPVVDLRTRLLILGSLPGDASLARQQYYGHPQNAFWRLLAQIAGVDLPALDYATRLQALRDRGIGLWDVIAEARREGSLDTAIRDGAGNDLVALIDTLPALTTIAFNGGTSAKLGTKALGQRASAYRIVALPSSSAAHTLPYADKLSAWLTLQEGELPLRP